MFSVTKINLIHTRFHLISDSTDYTFGCNGDCELPDEDTIGSEDEFVNICTTDIVQRFKCRFTISEYKCLCYARPDSYIFVMCKKST